MSIKKPSEGGGALGRMLDNAKTISLLTMAAIASVGCVGSSGAIREHLKSRALAQLGVEGEGLDDSTRFRAPNGRPAWVSTGCATGPKGFTHDEAMAVARKKAAEYAIEPDLTVPLDATVSSDEYETTCVAIPDIFRVIDKGPNLK